MFFSGSSKPQIEEFREKIVSACRGVPLAIIVIGQILSATSLQNWELILQKPDPFDEKSRIDDILDLSYRRLSSRLKACLLYMGYFPPHQLMMVDKLHLLWMAEGLISKTKEPEVQKYFEDLVNLNLVYVEEKEDMLASSWHLHDLIRDFCISRGEQEDIFEVIDFSHAKQTGSSTRRLAVYLHAFKHTNDVLLNVPYAKGIRSILFFDTVEREPESTWPSEFADLTDFLGIRVLDFDGVNFEVKGLPRGIEKLIYLRHLSFRGCYLQELPSSFGNFSFLETLDLRVIDSCTMTIPNILRKLSRLRHLYFPLAFQCDGKEKLKLGCLKNLEVVENFNADSCDTEDLQQLENLQILTGTLDGIMNLDMNIINSIKMMNSIGKSSLVVKGFDCYSKRRLSILAELLACHGLHALDLEGHLEVSPRDITFGHNFTKMVFDGSEFSEDPMPVLGKLRNLKSLVLRNDAFVGLEVVCHESDFPQLTSLKLAALQYLEKLEVEDGAMPNLTILTIEQCDKLDTLPHELLRTTLKEMMIGSMSETFHSKVKEIIEEQVSRGFVRTEATFYDC